MYGHLAVVIFIVLSGFSLAIAPARNNWQLGSARKYAHRRAWRILPPYWPALLFSLSVAWFIIPQPGEGMPTIKSIAVFGLLVQDVFQAPSPNGAFWSIAIEAQLYLIFPLLLLLIRRAHLLVMVLVVLLPVALISALSPTFPAAHFFTRFTPQLAVGFAAGMMAAGVVRSDKLRRYPWHLFAFCAVLPVVIVIVANGSVWTVSNFPWIDIALTPAIALFLAGLAVARNPPINKFLDSKPLRQLGGFSYSLYLTHAPIVIAVYALLVASRVEPGTATFAATTAIAVPICIVFARVFAGLFEFPFQKHKSWRALWRAIRDRLRVLAQPFRRKSPKSDHALLGERLESPAHSGPAVELQGD